MEDWINSNIDNALERVAFGQITLKIHEGQVVSIDISERRRERNNGKSAGNTLKAAGKAVKVG